jgi:diguanylate cyclase (GGDEF)-like protein/PAS domain S-box-containing protein
MQLTSLYTVVISAWLLSAGHRFVSNNPNLQQEKKQIQMLLIAVCSAGGWAIMGMFFQGNLVNSPLKSPELSTYAIVIFAFFVRMAMTRYALLPPTERKYQILYELSPLAIVLLDQKADIHDANPSALQLFNLTLKEIRQRSFSEFIAVADRISFLRQFESRISGVEIAFQEYSIIKNTREQRLVQAENELIIIDGNQYQYVILRDITESRLAEQRISFLAYHDPLTGLSNRSMFQEQLTAALSSMHEDHGQIAVMLMDLDRFKLINDTKGHHAGDLLLKYVANQLIEQAPVQMKIARLGGDEFALFITGIVTEDQVHQYAHQILQGLRKPFIFEESPFYITASLGICLSPQFGDNPDILLKFADIAMYYSKHNGRDRYQIYNHQLKHPELDSLAMELRLRQAIDLNEFEIHYQPQLEMESGAIIGVEALIRWISPEKGIVQPIEFIHIAEESGLIIPLGRWILRQACQDMQAWIEAGIPLETISVNISLCQFKDDRFLDELINILEETGLEPRRLCLEITESTALENQEYTMGICREIKRLQVGLSIDDFGTGYSSFSLLKLMKFDAIKIDRSFVKDIVMDEEDAAIINAIIVMAHGLKQLVIAEGVEDAGQLERLRALGCDQIQGFHVSKALSAKEFIQFLRNP